MKDGPLKLPKINLLPLQDRWPEGIDSRASAVLALFVPYSEDHSALLFTRRSADLRSHAGQVGFPGGRREIFDDSPAATALREANEEIALDPAHVTLLGALPTLKSLDGKPVLPVVGKASISWENLTANPSEVAEIFVVPWPELVAAKRLTLRFNIFGKWRGTPHFEAHGHHVWGLTAWMIDRMAMEL